jgi:hypothetical protein
MAGRVIGQAVGADEAQSLALVDLHALCRHGPRHELEPPALWLGRRTRRAGIALPMCPCWSSNEQRH